MARGGGRGRHGLVVDQAPQSLGTLHRPRVPWKILAPICCPPFGSSPRRFRTKPIPPPSRAGTSSGGDHLVLESAKLQVRPVQAAGRTGWPRRVKAQVGTTNTECFLPVLGPPFNFVVGQVPSSAGRPRQELPSPSMQDGHGLGWSPGAGRSPSGRLFRPARRPPTRRRPVVHDRRA
jgi:hypothetical protein